MALTSSRASSTSSVRRAAVPGTASRTHATLRTNLVEEAYEAWTPSTARIWTPSTTNWAMCSCRSCSTPRSPREHGEFTIADVTSAITHKMIFRHQHVFGTARADTADEVLDLWQKVKKAERHQETQGGSAARGHKEPAGADAREKKCKSAPRTWALTGKSAKAAFYKIGEEAEELSRAVAGGSGVEEEAGDLLFAVVQRAAAAQARSRDRPQPRHRLNLPPALRKWSG